MGSGSQTNAKPARSLLHFCSPNNYTGLQLHYIMGNKGALSDYDANLVCNCGVRLSCARMPSGSTREPEGEDEMRRTFQSLLVIAVIIAMLPCGVGAVQYQMRDLGLINGSASSAHDINDAGEVVCQGSAPTGSPHSYAWQGGEMQDLDKLNRAAVSHAYGINGSGHIAGSVQWGQGPNEACLLRQGADPRALDAFPGNSYGLAINDEGQIVGYGYPSGTRGFVWQDGQPTMILGTLGGDSSWAHDINNSGTVVGWAHTAGNDMRMCTWQDGSAVAHQLVGGPTIDTSCSFVINDSGLIAGTYRVLGTSEWGTFLWQDGVTTYLSGFGGTTSDADRIGINSAGHVVGSFRLQGTTVDRACIWRDGLPALYLGSDWDVNGNSYARAINGSGQIVGEAQDDNGVYHAVLWEPVPEPSPMLAVLLGLLGTTSLLRRRTHPSSSR